MRATRLIYMLLLGVIVFPSPSSFAGEPDQPSLATAHGLLKRGLFDLAEAEYKRFLASESDDEDAMTQANYGLAVALVRQNQHENALPILARLYKDESVSFAPDVAILFAQCRMSERNYTAAAEIIAESRNRFAKHALADDAAALGIEALYRAGLFDGCATNASVFLEQYANTPSAGNVTAYGGMSLAATRKDEEAIVQLRRALKYPISDTMQQHVRLALAETLQRNGNSDQAIANFESVRKSDGPLAGRAALGLASVYWRSGDLSSASAMIDEALSKPSAIDQKYAWLIRGRISFDQNEFDDALKALTKAGGDASPYQDHVDYWMAKSYSRKGEDTKAVDVLKIAVEKHQTSELVSNMIYDLGAAQIRMSQFESAIITLLKFLSEYPRSENAADALQMLAGAYYQTKDYKKSDEAIAAWSESKSSTALPTDLAFIHAENAFLTEDYRAASRRYESFLNSNASDDRTVNARRRLGLAYYRLHNHEQALAQFNQLSDVDQTPATLFSVGDIYFEKRDWKNAAKWLDRFIESHGDAPTDDGLIKSGLAYMRLAEFEIAMRRFTSIIDSQADSPHLPQALFERGQSLLALDRLEDASKSFQRVLTIEDGSKFHAAAREHLAAIGLRLGRPDLAAQTYAILAESLSDSENKSATRLRQAEALMQASKFGDAVEVLVKQLENENSPEMDNILRANLVISLARNSNCKAAIKNAKRIDFAALDDQLATAARYDWAYCLRESGELTDAAKVFEIIANSKGQSALRLHAMLALTGIYVETDSFESAQAYLSQLVTAKNNNELPSDIQFDRILYRLGKIEFEQDRMPQAENTLKRLLDEYPNSELVGAAAYLAGEAAFSTEQWETAIARLSESLKGADNAEYRSAALLRLGDAYARLQRWKESEAQFAAFLKDNAESEFAYQAQFGIGWARENQNNHDEAITAYRDVTNHHKGPTAARAQFQIGQCLFAKKDYESAVRELLKTDILYSYAEWSAAAIFEAGRCLEQMNRRGEAREQFSAVVQRFGSSKWAAPAADRLRMLASSELPGD